MDMSSDGDIAGDGGGSGNGLSSMTDNPMDDSHYDHMSAMQALGRRPLQTDYPARVLSYLAYQEVDPSQQSTYAHEADRGVRTSSAFKTLLHARL